MRDQSWARPEAMEFIRNHGYNVACLDYPLARRAFREKAVTTGPIAYLRLHGRNYEEWFSKDSGRDDRYNYLYGEEEMEFNLNRLETLREKADRVVAIWNNHYRGQAVVNALECQFRLTGEKVDVPSPLLQSYPRLKTICQEG